ncbi:hypothetical protein K402DRAFT_417643 [Aulographum hederae CBS 113979]|uniref:Nucleotide-diphospho-sugar transferase domain-containing protein n=1 Tax=Aulographum hederae CBS 113979 TaxID=1176131 RepID=A0A6G1HD04_9PEZI|nr:hypothetical protein K402DRAFT_417643 [Aulographum hederae CBS 113979]
MQRGLLPTTADVAAAAKPAMIQWSRTVFTAFVSVVLTLTFVRLQTPALSSPLGSLHSQDVNEGHEGQHLVLSDSSADFPHLLRALYSPLIPAVTTEKFTTYNGKTFALSKNPNWTEPLGKDLCIVDIDTRPLDGADQLMGDQPLNWDSFGKLGAGMMNHYLYAMIHGYTYKFIRTPPFKDRAPYWTKIPALADTLHTHCKTVISIDADAVFTHLHLPAEWLFNRWQITPETSLAMALDPDKAFNKDKKGRRWTNAGFIVANDLPRTHEMLRAWANCPDNTEKYPGCEKLKDPWPAEQGAFAEYTRYEFAEPTDVREIPCSEANGYPDGGQGCDGIFLRHFWDKKDSLLKPEVARGVAQDIVSQALRGLRSSEDVVEVRKENTFREFKAEATKS